MNIGYHIAMADDKAMTGSSTTSKGQGKQEHQLDELPATAGSGMCHSTGHYTQQMGPAERWDCLVFHDLDMLPMSSSNFYNCSTSDEVSTQLLKNKDGVKIECLNCFYVFILI